MATRTARHFPPFGCRFVSMEKLLALAMIVAGLLPWIVDGVLAVALFGAVFGGEE